MTISDLTVRDFGNGVALAGGGTSDHLTFDNIEAISNDAHGLFLAGASLDNVALTNVNSSDNGLAGSAGRGVYFTDGTKTNISITGGTFDHNLLVGIDLNDGSASGITITGNQVIGNGDSGIGVLGAKGPGTNLIADNTVTDNGRFGIEIKNPTGNGQSSGPGSVVVSNNTVTRTVAATDARDYAGIAVFRRAPGLLNADQPTGAVVTGNTVSGYHRMPVGSTGDGFGIVVEGLGQVVTGNIVSNNDIDIQIQAGNTANTQNTPYFDRGDASVSSAVINGNTILTSTNFDLRNMGAPTTDATCNAYDSATGPAPAKVLGGFLTVPFYLTSNTSVPCGVPTGATATAGDARADVSWSCSGGQQRPSAHGLSRDSSSRRGHLHNRRRTHLHGDGSGERHGLHVHRAGDQRVGERRTLRPEFTGHPLRRGDRLVRHASRTSTRWGRSACSTHGPGNSPDALRRWRRSRSAAPTCSRCR